MPPDSVPHGRGRQLLTPTETGKTRDVGADFAVQPFRSGGGRDPREVAGEVIALASPGLRP